MRYSLISTVTLPAIASGLLVALSFPPFGVDVLAWVAFVPLLVAVRGIAPGSAFLLGAAVWLVPFAAVGVGLVHVGPLVAIGYPVVAAAVVGAAVAAYAAMAARGAPAWSAVLAPAAVWVAGEQVGNALAIPWSYALTQVPRRAMLQPAAFIGGSGLSFAILAVNGALAEAMRRGSTRACGALALAGGALGAVALVGSVGAARLAAEVRALPALRIASVQPMFPSELYTNQWLNPSYRETARRVVGELSEQAAVEHPDLLLWPENGNGQLNFQIPALRRAVESLATRSRSVLLLSSYETDPHGRFLNAVFAVDPDGRVRGRHAKVALVPGREAGFAAGGTFDPLPTAHGPVGTLVCLESCLAAPARQLVARGAELLVVTTSDVGMRNSIVPLFHDAYAVLRAVENGRWLVQSSNGGASFVVDPFGRVTAATSALTRGVLRGRVDRVRDATVYTRLGDWPARALTAIVLAASWWTGRRRRAVYARTSALSVAAAVVTCVGLGLAVGLVTIAMTARGRVDLGSSGLHAVERFFEPVTVEVPPGAEASFLQSAPNTCGVAALAYVLHLLGFDTDEAALRPLVPVATHGSSMADLATAAAAFGVRAWGERQDAATLAATAKPLIAHVDGKHWVVVLAAGRDGVDLFDPAMGYVTLSRSAFDARWDRTVLVVRLRDALDPTALVTSQPVACHDG